MFTANPDAVPHSKEAEEAVIGAVIVNPQMYLEVSDFITPESFYIHRNRMVWQAIASVAKRDIPIDFLTVSEELNSTGRLAELGGLSYLTSLVNNVPTSMHADAYARIVEKNSIRRKLITAAGDIARFAYSEIEPEEAISKSENTIKGISDNTIGMSSKGFSAVKIDQEFRAAIRDPAISIKSYIPNLDERIGGFFPRTSTFIAGVPGVGKTTLCLQVCKSSAYDGKRALFISIEMSRVSLWARMACPEAGLEWSKVRDGSITEVELEVLSEVSKRLAERLDDRFIVEDEVYTLSAIHKSVLLHKPDIVVVDNMSEIVKPNSDINNVVWFAEVAQYLRHIARTENIPIIVVHHLRRIEDRQDKRPQLSDLKWSGDIERVADVVLMPHREDIYAGRQPGVYQVACEVWVRKNREGDGSMCAILSYDLKAQWFS